MKALSAKMKNEALRDLKMYFGKPPYDIEYVRLHHTSGLFEQQALAKYGRTPIELMQELHAIYMSEKTKEDALNDLTLYFGEPPVPKGIIIEKLSSGSLERRIVAKYLMTVDDLIEAVGFEVSE